MKKRLLSLLLSLCLVAGLFAGMSTTAFADGDTQTYIVQSGENPFMAFDREDIQTQPEGTVILHTCSMGFKSGEYGGRYTKTTLSTIS